MDFLPRPGPELVGLLVPGEYVADSRDATVFAAGPALFERGQVDLNDRPRWDERQRGDIDWHTAAPTVKIRY